MFRIFVLVMLVVGVLAIGVGEIFAARPPIHDWRIPIYLGDPDNVDCSRPRDRGDVKIGSSFGRCDLGIGFVLFEVRVWFGGRQGKDRECERFSEVTCVKGLMLREGVGFVR